MNWIDHFRDGVSAFIAAVVAAIVAAFGWLVRTVFTNQRKIELLEQALSHRDIERKDMRDDITEVKDSVKRIENVLLRDVTGRL
jgi:hypothetical protein